MKTKSIYLESEKDRGKYVDLKIFWDKTLRSTYTDNGNKRQKDSSCRLGIYPRVLAFPNIYLIPAKYQLGKESRNGTIS